MENIKPPAEFVPYNGEKKWETWREAFEIFSIAADLESMPLVRQRPILKHILGEKTVSIYKTFRVTENEAYPSIKEMLDMLSKHFKPFKNIIQIRNKFFTSVQKEGQGIIEFVTELKQLAQECEFEELAESLIRDRFIIGMIVQEVKKKLLEEPQLTLPKEISVATIAESVCVQIASWEEKQAMIEKINKNTWEKNRSRVEKAKAGPSIANTRNECKWCGQQHTYGNCPAYRKTCNACGKLNHFAAVCRTRRIRNLIAENEGDESFEGGINVNKVLVKTVRSDKWSAVISINGNKTSVHLDTGAQINVLPQKVISLWPAKPIIKPTSLKAYAYGHSELPIVGKCEVLCQYGEKKSLCEFIIADVDAQTLITGDTCEKLEILKRINQINSHEMILHDQTKKILEKFHEVFQGVGVINSECKMYTKPEYPPVRALPRRIPASLGNEVQSELEKMVKQGIITKIYHETEWSHPMVVVKKKSGQFRICLDPRKLNQALVRRHFQTPAPSELLHQIPKADFYTVLDVKSAYWHVPVANECRDLLVMATPFGKFRYNRLPFGLNISAQIFVEMMTNIFKNSFWNVTYVDDLLIYEDSIEEHNEKLKGILEIARRNNIKFDLTKAQICKKEVRFLGHMISKNGIDPEPNKVDKVINLKKPEDKKSLQRIMGLYNYLGKFIPNLAASTSNIRGILKKNVVWHWGPRQDIEFHHIKECVRNAPSLGHYDKTKTDTHPIDELPTPFLEDRRMVKLISANISDEKLITLQKDTREDTTLLKIIHYVIEGWPISKKDVDEDVKPYYDFRHRIYLWNELLCVGSAIVVPGTQRNYMLELLHKSHQGISAIQGLARESLFWPGMSMDIAERVKSCDICQKYQKSKTRKTLRSFPIPDYPWQTVSMDIFYIERKPHLLIVDRFSGYPEVYALNPPTATNVRNKLRETFARFGIPETIMSDNGPPFHSEIMTDFCTKWGIRQIFSSPHLHRSNGLAERNIQTIKTLLNKCKDQGSDAYMALLTYRNTPKNDLPSPAQLCLSRSLRCLIPRITPLYGPCKTNQRHIENAKKRRQNSMKKYYDRSSKIYPKVSVGEEAWCQLSPKQAWTPVKITAHGNSPQSFKVETPSGKEFLRNQQFLRPKKWTIRKRGIALLGDLVLSVLRTCKKISMYVFPRDAAERDLASTGEIQENREPVDEFITSLYKLADSCEFEGLHEQLIRDRIVVGVRDKALSERMQLDSELTLEKAVKMVRQQEAVRQQQVDLQRPSTSQKVNQVKFNSKKQSPKQQQQPSRKKEKSAKTRSRCPKCGGFTHREGQACRAEGQKCNLCSKTGHFANCCPDKQAKTAEVKAVSELDEEIGFLLEVSAAEDSSNLDDDEDECRRRWTAEIQVNGKKVKFKLDSQADVTCVPLCLFKKIMGQQRLVKSDINLRAAEFSELQTVGMFISTLRNGNYEIKEKIYVIRRLSEPLLSRRACELLNLARRIEVVATRINPIKEFPEVFEGLGQIGNPYEIKLKPGAKPYAVHTPRRVPIPLMEKLKTRLEELEKAGIIAQVNVATEWCAPTVIAGKPNGDIRLCVDLSRLNEHVQREVHPMPVVEHMLGQLGEARFFSKLDANSGFHQIPLSPDCQHLTTFITPFGRYKYCRMPFGISLAPEYFQRVMSIILQGMDGVMCYLDDILIFASDSKTHDRILRLVLRKLKEAKVTLNKAKCVFGVPRINFLGHILDEDGIRPDPAKIEAVARMPAPTDVHGVRRFLGMVNHLGRFVENLSEIVAPLNQLLVKGQDFVWDCSQERAFRKLKELLTTQPILAAYDVRKPTMVSSDASSYGLGAVLKQEGKNGIWRPVAYSSRTMTPTEKRYAQIEKEALAITWACERFQDFLLGKRFRIETDHKPLIPLFSTKELSSLTPRLQRFRMRMMRFGFEIVHIPGKELLDADALSRQPLLTTEGGEDERPTSAHINAVLSSITDKDEMLTKIFEAQQEDTTLKAVVNYLEQGWPDKKKMSQALLSYWHVKDELGVQNGLLMRSCRLVIPASMKLEILDKLHAGHFGITKTRLRARETVWWPGISEEIAETVRKCSVCIQEAVSKHEPLIPTNFPTRPWQKIGMDLFKFENKWYLVVIDYYSRYPEMVQLDRLTASVVVRSCKSIFARHGVPETVVSDNGTQFGAAREFANFARQYGFTHVTSSPRFPQSNGMAEAGVKIAKLILKKNQDPSLGLLEYRSTPLENGYSPAELLMGRKLRTTLPIAPENLNPKLVDSQTLKRKEGRRRKDMKSRYDRRCGATDMEELSEGDTVWITDMRTWGIVKKKASTPRSYMVDTPVGTLCRNRFHLRKGYAVQYPADPSTPTFSEEELVENEKTPVVDYPSNDSEDGQIRTRSGRIVKPKMDQKSGETISKYIIRLKEQAQRCNFGDVLQESLRDRFVAGIIDTPTQKKLLQEEGLTFEGALDIALSAESADNDLHNLKRSEDAHLSPQHLHAINNPCKHC
ncbi:K02A2.6-like, partial [Cordylochernes scorpioides]